MSIMEIQSLNQNVTNDRISMPYPHIRVLEPSNALALMVPSLPKGDLPVICEYDGTTRQIASIRKSALVISKLRKISNMEYAMNEKDKRLIDNPLDVMEVLI